MVDCAVGRLVCLLAAGGPFIMVEFPRVDEALGASERQKNQARQSLYRVMNSRRAVETAYACGNSAEARTRFQQARSSWNNISPVISAREAREAQLSFPIPRQSVEERRSGDLGPIDGIGMLEELREDHDLNPNAPRAVLVANDPPLILADKPTINLDDDNPRNVMFLLCNSCSERGKTLIVAAHNNYAMHAPDATSEMLLALQRVANVACEIPSTELLPQSRPRTHKTTLNKAMYRPALLATTCALTLTTCRQFTLLGPRGSDLPTRRQPKHHVQQFQPALVAGARTHDVVKRDSLLRKSSASEWCPKASRALGHPLASLQTARPANFLFRQIEPTGPPRGLNRNVDK